jgi:antitoxin component of MazEF toxin-antitoxin module
MSASRLVRIGNSMGVILPRRLLNSMSWWQADMLHVEEQDGRIVIRNLTQKQIQPMHTRYEHGDAVSGKA